MSHMMVVPDGEPSKPACRCPFCGVLTTITPIRWTYSDWIAQCDNSVCRETFYAKVSYKGFEEGGGTPPRLFFEVIETYPKFVPQKHESIPNNVWSDYLEACKSYDVKAFKATVIMCRRMLQNVCHGRGAENKNTKGDWISLRNQIEEAFSKKEYPDLHSFAEEVKYFGDYGAHPQDDNVDDVSEEISKRILDFSYRILEIAYVNPWGLKKLQQSKG